MAILDFNAKEVAALILHARSATRFMTTPHALALQAKRCEKPGLILVTGAGIYLMSNGLSAACPADHNARDICRPRAYAHGCSPQTDPGWFRRRGEILGMILGPHPCHQFLADLDGFETILARGDPRLYLRVGEDGVKLYDPARASWHAGARAVISPDIGMLLMVEIMEIAGPRALVRNRGNGAQIDAHPPFEVALDELRAPQTADTPECDQPEAA